MTVFTHISGDRIHMVDVSAKDEIYREATASGGIILRRETIRAITDGTSIKVNVLATARVAATFAVKDTARGKRCSSDHLGYGQIGRKR